MAEEEVIAAASPVPSDHKRKHEDLDSEPFDQPSIAAVSNGNSEAVADADGDADAAAAGVSPPDPDVKRPRLEEKPDESEATENGHQEEKGEESKEEVAEPPVVEKNRESEEGPEKVDEPLDAASKEPLADETHTSAIELQSAGIPEESAKEEHQEPSEGHQNPPPDVTQQGDADDVEEQPTSSGKLTSRKMEVPSNKVGVLIGKAGDTIRTLQNSSGARIQITRDADADLHSTTRPVELIGSLENINKAEKLIKDVIAEADAGGSPSLVAKGFSVQSSGAREQVEIQVPTEKVGLVIGKGGETIKNLQTRSGARIQLIPQHLPEGDQSKERTVRVTGDRRQIEIAKDMIKEAMDQPIRSSAPSSGNNQQAYRSRGPSPQWGPRGHHPSQPTGYNNYPQRGSYPSHSPRYSSQAYGNYPPQQPPPRNNFGWDQRPPTNTQGPPEQTGYDYYGGHGAHRAAPSPQPPMHSHAPGPAMGPPPSQVNYNYGQPQGPDYGPQPSPYPQTAPQGYGHGYGDAKYDNQGPPPHPYGGHSTQPSTYPQVTTHPGYGQQQDQYGKPPAYNVPQQGPYAQPYGQPRQQPYPYASGGPVPQAYPQYGTTPAPPANDGYNQAASTPGGYPQQSGQPVSGYASQMGGQPQAPGYTQAGPATGYGQYPSTQPGYTEQAAPSNAGYGYQGAADPAYAGGPGMAYGGAPAVQPAYSQPAPAPAPTPAPAPAPVPAHPGYDQSIPQTGGYMTQQPQPQPQPQPQAQAQPGYVQYDSSQMYAGHR